ncbi:hypothetical protein ACN28S_62355 [Cystobacter fuscus]
MHQHLGLMVEAIEELPVLEQGGQDGLDDAGLLEARRAGNLGR